MNTAALHQLPAPTVGSSQVGSSRASYWHEQLVDFMLTHPGASLADCARFVNKSYTWVSSVRGSDSFVALYNARRRALSERLDSGIQLKLAKVADKALDILADRLEAKRDTLTPGEAFDLADGTLSRLGYGVQPKAPTVGVNVNVNGTGGQVAVPIDRATLDASRNIIRSVEQARANAAGALIPIPPTSHGEPSQRPTPAPTPIQPTSSVADTEIVDLEIVE